MSKLIPKGFKVQYKGLTWLPIALVSFTMHSGISHLIAFCTSAFIFIMLVIMEGLIDLRNYRQEKYVRGCIVCLKFYRFTQQEQDCLLSVSKKKCHRCRAGDVILPPIFTPNIPDKFKLGAKYDSSGRIIAMHINLPATPDAIVVTPAILAKMAANVKRTP